MLADEIATKLRRNRRCPAHVLHTIGYIGSHVEDRKTIDVGQLYYGDNLEVLRSCIDDSSIDLIYLDPPFNSNASYNILFKSQAGTGADASIEAFDDTWQWGPAASMAMLEITRSGNHRLHALMQAMRTTLGENAMMAYLAMMAVRLIELYRVLKPTGSLYLHCDPTASHYLKLILDAVFKAEHFRNEIVWRRYGRPKGSQFSARKYGSASDTIFFYTKSEVYTFEIDRVRPPLSEAELSKMYPLEDVKGRYMSGPLLRSASMGARPKLVFEYNGFTPGAAGWRMNRKKIEALDDQGDVYWTSSGQPRRKVRPMKDHGLVINSLWTDIEALGSQAQERLGYPTQKPILLLERIIAASSNPGDIVLDPFCGCGTAVDAAQKLGRRWIGIDVTHLAIGLIEKRLREGYGDALRFETIGVPKDRDSALRLAADRPHEFQNWFCLTVGGYPLDGGRKGADRGIDGHFYPYETSVSTTTGAISVKAGTNIGPSMLRDLRGVMEREGFPYGLFLSAHEPTKPMRAEAAAAGMHANQFGAFPRLQILTPDSLFSGRNAKLPPLAPIHRRAARVETRASHRPGAQPDLL